MILPMAEEAAYSDSEQLAYLRGREDEPGMQCDMQWDRATLPEALRRCGSKWGERDLLVFAGERITVNAFAREVSRFAGGLRALGVRRGDSDTISRI